MKSRTQAQRRCQGGALCCVTTQEVRSILDDRAINMSDSISGVSDGPRRFLAAAYGLSPSDISPAALSIVKTLQGAGYSAEVVGGCLRDLLLGHTPKDFDVVTDATPEQVRSLFRRVRLIGRRFRLAHVRIGRDVIEVSTYRGTDTAGKRRRRPGQSMETLSNNVFGSRDEDVYRRDFTINALYYDPMEDVLFDYVGGLEDIQGRILRLIGDPATRLSEDPVRMLRAIRFRAKLGLSMDPSIEALLPLMARELTSVSSARLFEEIIKVLHNGYGALGFQGLRLAGLLDALFPSVVQSFSDVDLNERTGLVPCALRNTDQRVRDGKPIISPFLFSILLWRSVQLEYRRRSTSRQSGTVALYDSANAIFQQLQSSVTIPRRVSSVMVEIWDLQMRLEARRPRSIQRLLEHRRFRAAYDFLLLRAGSGEAPKETVRWWTQIQELDPAGIQLMIKGLQKTNPRRRNRAGRKKTRT